MFVRQSVDQGVGISNKSITSRISALRSTRSKTASQTKTLNLKHRKTSIGRWVKLGTIGVIAISFATNHLAGRVTSESQYVAPQARLTNSIATPESVPVDEVIAAEVAATVAVEADLLVTPNASNRAITLDAQATMVAQTDDGAAPAIEKPQFIAPDDAAGSGIIKITVKSGDTLASLAAQYGIDQNTIRWANDLDTDRLEPGTRLTILPVSGVLHTVKAGETVKGIASLYKANADQISAFNDIELRGLQNGSRIIVPGGIRPTTPDTPIDGPATAPTSDPFDSYAFGGSAPLFSGNRYSYGYCTWYAYNRRAALGRPVASNWGHAATWATLARSSGFSVNRTPKEGAVFQTAGGWGGYGHVGIVEAVHRDGSVTVSEMNYAGWNVMSSRKFSSSEAKLYEYIH